MKGDGAYQDNQLVDIHHEVDEGILHEEDTLQVGIRHVEDIPLVEDIQPVGILVGDILEEDILVEGRIQAEDNVRRHSQQDEKTALCHLIRLPYHLPFFFDLKLTNSSN